jgi:pantetheine-phosphate adenylyltransferase
MNTPLKIGIYPGSFNPFHQGHLDIVRQAQQIFDAVTVVRAINPDKKIVQSTLPEITLLNMNVSYLAFNGLITDLITEYESIGMDVTLIRGLRSGADLEYEQNLVAFMRNMHPQLKVVFLLCKPEFQHISSSALRGIRQFSEKEYKKYVIE